MKKIIILLPILAATLLSAQNVQNQNTRVQVQVQVDTEAAKNAPSAASTEPKKAAPKKVAIFVRNDSTEKALDAKSKMLESSLSALINNLGFGVINHDLAIRNLNAYLGNPNAKYKTAAQKMRDSVENNKQLDVSLFENASGLRLAEMIGADYILSVSYSSFGKQVKKFSGYGVATTNIIYTLRSNYNLYEGGGGVGTAGGVIKSSKSIMQTENLGTASDDDLNELVDDTALQMASLLHVQKEADQIIAKDTSAGMVDVQFQIEAFSFPEIKKGENGEWVVGTNAIPATIPFVNAEIDGVLTTIGGKVKLGKGIHTFRIKQKDIEPTEGTINITGDPQQTLMLTLSLTDAARARWKTDMQFIEKMKDIAQNREDKRKISEAQVKQIEGIAQMLRNSGFKIDLKSDNKNDVKVDAKNLPDVKQVQSVFGQ